MKLKVVDAALARGIADAEAGQIMPAVDAFARIRARLADEGGVGSVPSGTSDYVFDQDGKDFCSIDR